MAHIIFSRTRLNNKDIGRFTQHLRQHAHGLRQLLRHQLWQLHIEQQETALPAEQIASGLRAFLPRPEGRGLTRILVKPT
jgi:hypothetical protein